MMGGAAFTATCDQIKRTFKSDQAMLIDDHPSQHAVEEQQHVTPFIC